MVGGSTGMGSVTFGVVIGLVFWCLMFIGGLWVVSGLWDWMGLRS